MGQLLSRRKREHIKLKEHKILMLGLDNAGKTCMLKLIVVSVISFSPIIILF